MGARLDTTGLRRVEAAAAAWAGLTLRVGILGAGASALQEGSSITLADLGLLHEFGAPGANIPERSWLRSVLIGRQQEVVALKVATMRRVLALELAPRAGLEYLGEQIVAMIKAGIRAGIAPENAPATVKAKSSSKPLIEDGQLIDAITYEVVAASTGAAA